MLQSNGFFYSVLSSGHGALHGVQLLCNLPVHPNSTVVQSLCVIFPGCWIVLSLLPKPLLHVHTHTPVSIKPAARVCSSWFYPQPANCANLASPPRDFSLLILAKLYYLASPNKDERQIFPSFPAFAQFLFIVTGLSLLHVRFHTQPSWCLITNSSVLT
ncbi:hypothetical protein IF1G_08844 [Cordyceps javanica]|uniref:Uncharacterized protein n=1 Tax=Cordyceps javanica TaxID=43265 RepID=A0A545USA0_9HYPO|nr:hypothetical protein IF1G_08844 [Cordyceps javanica]